MHIDGYHSILIPQLMPLVYSDEELVDYDADIESDGGSADLGLFVPQWPAADARTRQS